MQFHTIWRRSIFIIAKFVLAGELFDTAIVKLLLSYNIET